MEYFWPPKGSIVSVNGGTGEITITAGTPNVSINTTGSNVEISVTGGGGGGGDVTGPASSVDNAITRYNGTTGKIIQDSAATLSDTGALSALSLTATDLTIGSAVVTDGSKKLASSSTTATELGYVSGVTSSIQTQINSKQATGNYITALTGDVVATGPGSVGSTIQAGVIDNAKVNASAAIAYSKLSLTGAIVNADINASAAVAYSKLNLANSIVNADVSNSAAIAVNKLAATTANRALISDASGFLSPSSVTSTQLGYLGSTTSDVQTQLDSKVAKSTLTTKGDIYAATGASTVVRQGVGSDGLFLKADSTQAAGLAWASPLGAGLVVTSKTSAYTATTSDDVILCQGSAFTLTLYSASGNSGKQLVVKKVDASITNIITIDASGSETIDGALTVALRNLNESIKIISDGSNWQILETYENIVACSYWTNASQSIANSGDVLVIYEDKIFDTHNAYNTTTGVYTCPTAGKYRVSATILTSSATWALGNAVVLTIYANGTAFISGVYQSTSAVNQPYGAGVYGTVTCFAGTTLDIRLFANRTAGSTTLSNSQNYNVVCIERIN